MADIYIWIKKRFPWTDNEVSPPQPYDDGELYAFDGNDADDLAAAQRILAAGAGVETQTLHAASGTMKFGTGTEALPSIASLADAATGWWFPAVGKMAASIAGAAMLTMTATGAGFGTDDPQRTIHAVGAGYTIRLDTQSSVAGTDALYEFNGKSSDDGNHRYAAFGMEQVVTTVGSERGRLRFMTCTAGGGVRDALRIEGDCSVKFYDVDGVNVSTWDGDNGYLGLVTTDPTEPLHVVGNALIDGKLFLDADKDSYWEATSDDIVELTVGGTVLASFDSAGRNVVMGSGTSEGSDFTVYSESTAVAAFKRNDTGGGNDNVWRFNITSASGVGLGVGSFVFQNSGEGGNTTSTGFGYRTSTNTYPFVAREDGDVFFNEGCIAIGTTDPRTLIHAVYAGTASSDLSTAAADYHILLQTAGNTTDWYEGGIAFSDDGTTVTAGLAAVDDGSSAATALALFTGDNAAVSEAVRIASGGNVGIGTDNPVEVLHINKTSTGGIGLEIQNDDTSGGSAAIYFDAGNYLSRLYTFGNTGNMWMRSQGDIYIRTDNADHIILQTSAVECARFDEDGAALVGRNSPLPGGGHSIQNVSSSPALSLYRPTATASNEVFEIYSNANGTETRCLSVMADGWMQVAGTGDPSYALDVAGTVSANQFYLSDTRIIGTEGHIKLRTATTAELNDSGDVVNTNNGKTLGAIVYNTDTEKIVIAQGGGDTADWHDAMGNLEHEPA